MNLKELFDTRILERGRDYFKHSLVTDLHRDGNTIIASVAGSEDYEVIITLENGEPTNLYCSCPYAADGHNCKHMAAVLLAFDEKTESAAMHAARISAPTGLHLDPNTGEINIAAYRKRIKATIRQFSDRHGFIDYDSAPDFLNAMEEYLEHDVPCLTETGHIAEAFALCNLLFKAFSEADIDDDGELSQFASDVFDAWGEIIECADATQKNEMFKWFMSHLNGCFSDFMEEYIEQAIFENFEEPKYLRKKLDFIDRQIAQTSTESYRFEALILRKIRLLGQMQVLEHELLAYCRQFIALRDIRDYLIDYYISHNKTDDAITLLESAITAEQRVLWEKAYREKLVRLYQKQNAAEKYREQLWHLAADHGEPKYYRELKAQFTETEWCIVREKLFAETSPHFCANFYAADGLWSRLMEYVSREGSLSTLKRFEKLLVRHDPKRVLAVYADALESEAREPAGRSAYREWAEHLKHMETIPGGEEIAKGIADKWKMQYKNRSAMMDELRRAGF